MSQEIDLSTAALADIRARHYIEPGVLNALGRSYHGAETLALAAEIERLRHESELQAGRADWLAQEIEGLKRVLEPFAAYADAVEGPRYNGESRPPPGSALVNLCSTEPEMRLHVADCRRARDMLARLAPPDPAKIPV